ncbi:MAG: alpha/beta hydrolase [Candidatus Nitrosocosmicus sp.]|nr:alpha/beta hydrolase [Candidatus Nitrosocosmicus sp.]
MNKLNATEVFLSAVSLTAFLFLSLVSLTNQYPFTSIYAQQEKGNQKSIFDNYYLDTIPINKIKVGDIDIAYKIFGKGGPLVMINGYGSIMDMWNAKFLQNLATNHTVIIFDNRGIGNTTSGLKEFTIKQFAEDTSGLIDALKLDKADVLGFSMGGMIAQELALTHPNKVGKLVIYASMCGGIQSVPLSPDVQQPLSLISNSSVPAIEKLSMLIPIMFPQDWAKQNSNQLDNFIQNLKNMSYLISDKTLNLQSNAIGTWNGVCDQINKITLPTLSIVGTDDVLTVPANSVLITEKIHGSSLVQIKGGGHGMMHQYPDKMSSIILEFLSN